jgi:hypothetical protein
MNYKHIVYLLIVKGIKYTPMNALIFFPMYDVLEHVISYLDLASTEHLLLTHRAIYHTFRSNKILLYNLLIRHSIHELGMPIQTNFERAERELVYHNLRRLWQHFYRRLDSAPISDYIVFLVERNYHSMPLLKRLLQQLVVSRQVYNLLYSHRHNTPYNYTENLTNSRTLRYSRNVDMNRLILNPSDLQYILIHGSLQVIEVVLGSLPVSSDIVSYTVIELMARGQRLHQEIEEKIFKMMNYFLSKNCFKRLSRIDEHYFYNVMLCMIKYNYLNLLNGTLAKYKKYRCPVNYQVLVNYCLQYDNLEALHLVWIDRKSYDYTHTHTNTQITNQKPVQIIIEPKWIQSMVEAGTCRCLVFLVEHLLGNVINLRSYIDALCQGLARSTNGWIGDNQKQFASINPYLSDTNRETINRYLLIVSKNKFQLQ